MQGKVSSVDEQMLLASARRGLTDKDKRYTEGSSNDRGDPKLNCFDKDLFGRVLVVTEHSKWGDAFV